MSELRINEQISFLRKQKELTQEELAQALGVTNQAVSKWESGVCCPDIQLLPELADYFGVSVDELIGHKLHITEDIKASESSSGGDPKLELAIVIAKEAGKVSTSLLQRKLDLGYMRCVSLINKMESLGYIVKANGLSYKCKEDNYIIDDKTKRARQFCFEVKELADKYKLPFFIVTDGASVISNSGCEAVDHARKAHIEWEIKNGIDSKHDWKKYK